MVGDGSGNSVPLSGGSGSDNPADGFGPVVLGQYVVGTFTAGAATQQVVFGVDEISYAKGFQLGALDSVPVPELGTFITAMLSVGAFAGLHFARRRKS